MFEHDRFKQCRAKTAQAIKCYLHGLILPTEGETVSVYSMENQRKGEYLSNRVPMGWMMGSKSQLMVGFCFAVDSF